MYSYSRPYADQQTPCRKILNVSVRNRSGGLKPEESNAKLIWCHLCKCNYLNHEEFRMHIMKKHRPSSQFYEGNSDTDDSEQMEEFATNIQCSQGFKQEKCFDEDSYENAEMSNCNAANTYQSLHNNTFGASVPPQPLSSRQRSENKNSSKTKFNLSKVKKEMEEVDDSSANFNSGTTNSIASQAIPSPANQNTPQMISYTTNQITPQLNPIFHNPQFILNNNQLQLVNPYNQQSSYFMGNQPPLQFNPVVINAVPISQKEFAFNAKNILDWNFKLKKLTKSLKYPLKRKLLKKIKSVHADIYHNCHFFGVQTDKEKTSLLKIYHDLELMICKHNEFVHE